MLEAHQVRVDPAQHFIDAFLDIGLLGHVHAASLLDLREHARLGLSEVLIDEIKDLFANFLKIIVKLFQGGRKLLLPNLEHIGPLILQLVLALDELLLALPPRFLINLVLLAGLRKVEVAVVDNGGVIAILMLHALLEVHPYYYKHTTTHHPCSTIYRYRKR